MQITILQALLIGFWYYIGYSGTWFFGCVSYQALFRPLTAGFVVGLILGQPALGLEIGCAIQLIYIGFTAIGNAVPEDPLLAGTVATALAISAGLETGAACALAIPVSLLGAVTYPIRMTVSSVFSDRAEVEATKGNTKGIFMWNVVIPQVVWCVICVIPVFLAVYFGTTAVEAVLAVIPEWAMNGFNVIGGMLPALGVAITLKVIANKEVMPFFFLGFIVSQYLGLSNIVVGIVFLCVALAIVFLGSDGEDLFDFGDDQGERKSVLDKKTVRKVWWNWLFFAESGVSYVRLQGTGFMQAMGVGLSKMYTDKEELGQELVKHSTFFNTEPDFGTSILGIALAMEEERFLDKGKENRINSEEINAVKTGLMGPCAGIGDTLMQITLGPILIAFVTELAQNGMIAAPIILMVLSAAIIVPISYGLYMFGYRFGKNAMAKVIGGPLMKKILLAAGIVGCGVLGAMTSGFVAVNCGLELSLMQGSMILSVQGDIFDTLLSGLLPLLTVLGAYKLLKSGKSNMAVLGILFGVGFVLGALGILV